MKNTKVNQINSREIFLKNFIGAIIRSFPQEEVKPIDMAESVIEKETIKQIASYEEMIESPKIQTLPQMPVPIPTPQSTPKMPQITYPRNPPGLKLVGPTFPIKQLGPNLPIVREIPGRPLLTTIKPIRDITKDIREISLGKVSSILLDPKVISVECPGPEKPLLVNRSGIVQATGIMLNSEEISSFIKDISQKTKIPIISGVFKAAIGSIIVTALISEFVGTRFIIQKIMPYPNQ